MPLSFPLPTYPLGPKQGWPGSVAQAAASTHPGKVLGDVICTLSLLGIALALSEGTGEVTNGAELTASHH